MKFHFPSFRQYFESKFDDSFNLFTHNWTYYIIPSNKYFSAGLLQGIIIEALIKSLEAPIGPLDSAQRHSLFVAPPEAHIEALQEAMLDRRDYVEEGRIMTGAGERREFLIDVKLLQHITIEIRKEQDVALAMSIIPGDVWASDRGLEKKIYRLFGRKFSNRRCRDIMHALEEMHAVGNDNGSLRSCGRRVLI